MRSTRTPVALILLPLVLSPVRSAHATWTPNGVVVSVAGNTQERMRMIPDGSGGAFVVWQDRRSNVELDIYAQRILATGVALWTADGAPVCTLTGAQSDVAIVSDGSGGVIVVWQDARGLSTDIYAQRISSSGAHLWINDGVPVCTVAQGQTSPAVLSDGTGGAIVAWSDAWAGTQDADIYAQRIDASGVLQWLPADGLPVTTALGPQKLPVIVADGTGGAIILWEDTAGGIRMFAQRINASGIVQWPRGGVFVWAAVPQCDPVAISDGVGGALFAWESVSGVGPLATFDVLVNHIDGSGTKWPAAVSVYATSGHQQAPAILLAAPGEAVVVWQDTRGGATADVYAQRFSGAGAPQWAAGGIVLCSAANDQLRPEIASDGLGGMIVAWEDARNGSSNYDIYAQQLDASGAAQWAANGVVVCDTVNDQNRVTVVAAGAGAAIVAWEDHRTEVLLTSDLYAQRVPVGVSTAVSSPSRIPTLQVRENTPNPFTGGTTWHVGLPHDSPVRIDVYDVAGRHVRTIERHAKAGWQSIVFDGWDAKGQRLSSGVYFYKVTAAGETRTQKMTLVR